MKADIILKLGSDQYEVSLSPKVSARGKDQDTSEMIERAITRILREYSPAFGAVAGFVAAELTDTISAVVVSVAKTEPVPDAVY